MSVHPARVPAMNMGDLTEALAGSAEGFLPPGRMVTSDEGDGAVQPLWLSDGPATTALWTRMHAEHTRSGLWPLLLDSLRIFSAVSRE